MRLSTDLTATLLSLSTTRLPLRILSTARHQLSIYFSRFRNRLSTVHGLHLTRLGNLLDALVQFVEDWRDKRAQAPSDQKKKPDVDVMTSADLIQKLGRKAEGINLLEIEKYLRESKVGHVPVLYGVHRLDFLQQIARKISGYSVKTLEKAAGKGSFIPFRLATL